MKSLLKCILKKHYDRQLEADQNEFIETHYREVENMYQKMRGWRHDYHNHIQTLKFLAANNDIVGIREYLNSISYDLPKLSSTTTVSVCVSALALLPVLPMPFPHSLAVSLP